MDNLTLSLVVLIFFLGLFLYFATLGPQPPPSPTKREQDSRRVPAILKCNVAVSRLLHLEQL